MIKATLPLDDHNSNYDLSCCEKDDVEARVSYLDTKDIELNLETFETSKRNYQTNKELTGIRLQWNVVPGVQNVTMSSRTMYPRRVSRDDIRTYMTSTFTISVSLKLSNDLNFHSCYRYMEWG